MSPETSSTKLCPTCGTRVAENATRCVVCGSEFSAEAKPKSQKPLQGTQMPEIRLSLPAALGFLALFLIIVALVMFLILRGGAEPAAPEPTPTETPTITLTFTPTLLPTDTPTPTPLPPIEYQVRAGDTCYSIAAFFDVSANVIIQENNLSLSCTDLRVGQTLLIPRPTPTP
ncbi:MAG: LysM peptidoglycan-binding domain-containing protein, partial [Anaerolineales bacterium]